MNVASSDQLKTELVKSEQLYGDIAAAIREKVPKVSQLALYKLSLFIKWRDKLQAFTHLLLLIHVVPQGYKRRIGKGGPGKWGIVFHAGSSYGLETGL